MIKLTFDLDLCPMAFKLSKVLLPDMREVKSKLEKQLPDSLLVHGLIDMQLRYGSLKTKTTVYHAKNPKFGSFYIATPVFSQDKIQSFTAFWDTDEINDAEVLELLLSLSGFNWNLPFCCFGFFNIKQKLDPILQSYFKEHDINLRPYLEGDEGKGVLLSLRKQTVSVPEPPAGYVIRALPPSCASTMLSSWSYSFSETEEGTKDRLSKLEGIGAFRLREDGQDTLVAWTHQYMNGTIGMTYTLPEERKKGLAGIVTLTLAKRLMEQGRVPYVITEATKPENLKFHQNLGFEIIGYSGFCLYTFPEMSFFVAPSSCRPE